jgi:hypothetical protein
MYVRLQIQWDTFARIEQKKLDFQNVDRNLKYCNGFDQRIAMQRLRKQVTTRNNGSCVSVDECYISLLGSSQRTNELAG